MNLSKLPDIREFPFEVRSVKFSIEGLATGVDNIHYDVYLSPGFCKTVSGIVSQLIIMYTQTETILGLQKITELVNEKKEFKRLCHEIMLEGVNKAKQSHDIRIDFIAQAAVIKMLTEQIKERYEIFTEHITAIIRKYEISNNREDAIKCKERLNDIQQNRDTILRKVGKELFRFLIEVQVKDLGEMRAVNFGPRSVLPEYFFSNPLFHAEDIYDDFFLIEEYNIFFGHRDEDPYRYDTIIFLIKKVLSPIYDYDPFEPDMSQSEFKPDKCELDEILKQLENVDILFNYLQSVRQYKLLKVKKGDKQAIINIKKRISEQKKLLKTLYKSFKKAGLIKMIVATYGMQPAYQDYCPPLAPHLVLQFVISPKVRKGVETRLKRLRQFYRKDFSLEPLWKVIKRLRWITKKNKHIYFIKFLNDFIRYHRDYLNYQMFRQAIENINLATEEKIINLSRANNSLYEFLLLHERVTEVKPVINHVIVKADVRGSTDITHRMMERKLNPASHFSLNFFDPITEILSEYGAVKVFVEGDAIILAIFEREDTPEGWYSVARACGLALNMILILKQYNVRNKKYSLPIIESGIGICHRDNKPAFLFDGDNQIMISFAINIADRMSGCSKDLRKKMADHKYPFNLFLFQTASEEDIAATADDLFVRYNVNGIELNSEGFEKLSTEIDLRVVDVSIRGINKGDKFYTGKFPTTIGKYQRLVIRESNIPKVDADSLNVIQLTSRKYYEVCTNPKLYEYIKKMDK
ncbi:MAG: hypothetical protein GY795_07910 [Desulfobacterales bacterium]|nr:hypothetical protein [Desulfobacterales bacterium]